MQVVADLTFSVEVPGTPVRPGRCDGRVRADGGQITVELDPMPSLAGATTRPLVRPLADRLATLGLTVQLVGPTGPLIRLGAGVRAPWWQVALTHGRRVELVSVRALARSLGGPKVFEVALPDLAALPVLTRRGHSRRRRLLTAVRQLGRRVTGRRR